MPAGTVARFCSIGYNGPSPATATYYGSGGFLTATATIEVWSTPGAPIRGRTVVGQPFGLLAQIWPETAPRIALVELLSCRFLGNGGGHRQSGAFLANVDRVVVRNCLFDHNGYDGVREPTDCHNLYIHATCGEIVVENCVFARGGYHGLKACTDQAGKRLVVRHNLFLDNPCHIGVGDWGNEPKQAFRGKASIYGNVIVGGRVRPSFETIGISVCPVHADVTIRDNVFGPGVVNPYAVDAGSYRRRGIAEPVRSARTVADYLLTLGLRTADPTAAFVALCLEDFGHRERCMGFIRQGAA